MLWFKERKIFAYSTLLLTGRVLHLALRFLLSACPPPLAVWGIWFSAACLGGSKGLALAFAPGQRAPLLPAHAAEAEAFCLLAVVRRQAHALKAQYAQAVRGRPVAWRAVAKDLLPLQGLKGLVQQPFAAVERQRRAPCVRAEARAYFQGVWRIHEVHQTEPAAKLPSGHLNQGQQGFMNFTLGIGLAGLRDASGIGRDGSARQMPVPSYCR